MRRRRLLSLVSIAVLASVLLQVASALGGQLQLLRLHEVVSQDLGLDEAQADRWVGGKIPIGDDYSAFARGGDASRPATIPEDEVPWTTPVYIGFNRVQWMDPARLPGFPQGVDVNGALTVSVGGGAQLGSSYFVGTFVMGGEIPIHPPLEYHQQWDMPLSIPGFEPWIPLSQFPDDSWGQATFVASLAHGSGPPTLTFYYFQDGSILTVDLAGFAVISGNTVLLGFEADPSFFGDRYTGVLNTNLFADPDANGVEIGGRLALDVVSSTGSRVVTAPAVPLTESSFFPYPWTHTVVPGLPGRFDPQDVVPIVAPNGDLWFNLFMEGPWGPAPPTGFFSNYAQLGLVPPGKSFPTMFWGFQTHATIDEAYAGTPDGRVDSPGAFIMNSGSLMFGTGMPYDGGPLAVLASGGFLVTKTDPFQGVTDPFFFGPDEVVEADPMTFGGDFAVYDLVTGATIDPPPSVVATTMGATTTVVAQEPVDAAGGISLVVVAILIAIAILLFLLWWLWYRPQGPSDKKDIYRFGPTRERGRTTTGEGEDDGDDPRDTPPPLVYGEEIDEQAACGWGLYFHDGTREIPLREPAISEHLCCKYVVRVTTDVKTHEQAARGRQDAGAERLRIPDFDYGWRWVDLMANTSARSGPAGRLDWMQGLGDPTEQADLASDDGYWQRAQGEEPPEVAAHLYHREITDVDITFEPGCPEYKNIYSPVASSQLHVLATHECTNDAGDPCPVELSAFGFVGGWITGPGNLFTAVADMTGTDPDELERSPRAEDGQGPVPRPPWDGHDHAERDRVTYERSQEDNASDALERDNLLVSIENDVEIDAGQIVPVAIYPTTERVTAHIEGDLKHNLEIQVDLTPINCEANGCGGHGPCNCQAQWKMRVSGTGGSWIDAGKGPFEILRHPTGGDRREPFTGRKSWTGKS